ncbi:MAG: 2-oxoglutarate ferredoxin oxidoreductase subunit beta [Candidatus Azotimanducaceae bacterium]|jgi:2-oxoglutarate ferredoxin oxidoreductase subunit beta
MNAPVLKLTAKDYATDQEVRWCPGCGDYAILKTVQKLMPELGVKKENSVFVSGIGCSSRFPYYMNTFGFHTIHGRAPAVATGVKLANPELDVWVITGDGDGLSIGGNHMMHMLRRNVDLNILLFNNEIYGLTKGQYSPTSPVGTRSPSTPDGSVDLPLTPAVFAIGAGARFVARSIDTEMKHLTRVLTEAHQHEGASFVEILQNCPVYNDGIFEAVKDKKQAPNTRLVLENGQPLLFGVENQKGLRLNTSTLAFEIVTLGEDGVTQADIMVHDESNKVLAQMLSELKGPEFPVPVGVIYRAPATAYVSDVYSQRIVVREQKGAGDLNALLRTGHTWTVD